jgi:hypothetical protein
MEAEDAGAGRASVYRAALGAAFDGLSPVMRRYFGSIPLGSAGVGEGRYDVVGPRYPQLSRPFLLIAARFGILFPESGTDVPFVVENRPLPDGRLAGSRYFGFASRTRVMRDVMRADGDVIVERLGADGALELALRPHVVDGGMRLTSTRLAVRAAGRRIPLPRVARVTVDERDDSSVPGGQRVDVRVRMPVLGEVFRYSGAFTYRIAPDTASGVTASDPVPTLSMWLTENSPT